MARTAVSGRLAWRVARLAEFRDETPTARTLVFDLPGWPGHLAGQHVDVRLTAADGYRAQRSYSLAAPADGDRVELTVQRVADGEVSRVPGRRPYAVGDPVEIRGPVGGWFVWRATRTRAGAAGRGRLRHRAADGDGPRPPRGGRPHAVQADLLAAHPGRAVLRRRAAHARSRGPGRHVRVHPRAARRPRRHPADASTWPRSTQRAGRPSSARPASSAARQASWRRWRTSWSRSATTRTASARRGSAPAATDRSPTHPMIR